MVTKPGRGLSQNRRKVSAERIPLPIGGHVLVCASSAPLAAAPNAAPECASLVLTCLVEGNAAWAPDAAEPLVAPDCRLYVSTAKSWPEHPPSDAVTLVEVSIPVESLGHLTCAAVPGGEGRIQGGEHSILRFSSKMRVVVDEIIAAPVARELRHAYIACKAIELLCLALSELVPAGAPTATMGFRQADLCKAERARALMLEDLSAIPSLDRLARRVGLNRSKLASTFKHLYGRGVYEYFRDERLDLARRLIVNSDTSILQISNDVGYESVASFSKSFRSRFGVSPRACRTIQAQPQ
ncbi:AraC family transcriptional regulator [Phenylobacterium sp. LH3H17]|uniref:helix-turn-helix domain-containing protein n=1 Tax=Phenylobacterium sp. LH3H17 TaxID=2903901 RepID=UPI0020C94AFE|nr:AraC family transcriptional regulator [Phenylobacterium sp. LH3H17]UTP38301.1 AraC family transcriptional regulator [Phenylobacterium sp. LH3H17]